ncbi:sodium/potassium-transporting ATPase subunit alpha-A [Folsomia candida]|uniref:Sodium/potassium-transporting ATPase subunit alpha-A n=1 Tax=Folsomia candida TaxID=158441 RepID=A0A226F564_FOLCA|nr:sodium/potassium-transporting ATPase subunit alpha-A [Folsomia candida]OXA64568.1 Sodium/potassium-transporting ATPase subunit alpha-A [Folsomia candida]
MSKPKTTIDLVGDEWKLSVDEICARYGTNATTGLTTSQSKLNRKQYGKNEYKDKNAPKKSKEEKEKEKQLKEQQKLAKKAAKGEKKEEKKKDDVKKMDEHYGTISVLRDGQVAPMSSKKLVVGDIVELAAGQEVPADVRIIVSNGLQVDPSAVTAGSPKTMGINSTNDNPMETDNLAFFHSKVVAGSGRGVVIAVGKSTKSAQLQKSAKLVQ